MNTRLHTPVPLTRRNAFGAILAGMTLPTSRALAAKDVFVRSKPHINVLITAQTFSGETFTARLSDDLSARSDGKARGFLRLDLGGGNLVDYVAERGSLTLNSANQVTSVTFLLLERRRNGQLAEDYAMVVLRPAADPEECVVYDLVGPGVRLEPVRFDVPGSLIAGR